MRTRALLAAVPEPDPSARTKEEDINAAAPEIHETLSGCPYRARCPLAAPRCADEEPQLREVNEGHEAACHFA